MIADSYWTVEEITQFYKAETFITIFSETCHSILSSDRPISKEPTFHTQFVQDWFNPYPTAFPYGNGMVLHFYQQQESSTTKTVHKVINKGLKAYV